MTNSSPVTQALPIHAPGQKTKRWAALATLMLPVLLVSVDNTVLSFAVPAIAQALSPSSSEQLWIIDAYSLVLAGLLVPMGSLSDRWGRRRMLIIGCVGFALVSVLAAFAPSALALVIARALLGIFGAMLMPATLSLIRNIFVDPAERRTAIAVWAAMFSGGAALGPIVGGFLLNNFSWGSVFLMAVPILVLFLAVAPFLLPESKDPNPGPIDPLSIVLIMISMVSVTFGLTQISESGVDVYTSSAIIIGLIIGYFFVRRQLAREIPMLDVRLFSNSVFSGALIANLFSMVVDVGFLYFVSQHLQLVSGLDPMRAGLFLVPGLAMTIISGLYVVKLANKFHPATLVSAGLVLNAIAYVLVLLIGQSDAGLLLAFIILGTGVGSSQTISNDLILSSVPASKAGAASAISETSYEFGNVLGTVLIGGLLTVVYRAQIVVPEVFSHEQAEDAIETLGGATRVAQEQGGDAGAALLSSAQHAFDSGVVFSSAASALLMVVMAIVSYRMLRKAPAYIKPAEH